MPLTEMKTSLWKNRYWFLAVVAGVAFCTTVFVGIKIFGCVPSNKNPNLAWYKQWRTEIYMQELVKRINDDTNSTWKARYNQWASKGTNNRFLWSCDGTDIYIKQLSQNQLRLRTFGQNTESQASRAKMNDLLRMEISIPDHFDIRTNWKDCPTVHQVMNQGGCGSCWAVSSVSTIQDRICIHTNGTHKPQISAEELLTCYKGCNVGGRVVTEAYYYSSKHGLVTGGGYGSSVGCKPYTSTTDCGAPCATSTWLSGQSSCQQKCRPGYGRNYEDDHYYGKSVAVLIDCLQNDSIPYYEKNTSVSIIELLKREIFLNGPVSYCFTMYEDYQHYASGIYYQPTPDSRTVLPVYGHCNKIVGWGTENNIAYFTLMNTWGTTYGDKGFLKLAATDLLPASAKSFFDVGVGLPDLDRLPQPF